MIPESMCVASKDLLESNDLWRESGKQRFIAIQYYQSEKGRRSKAKI